MKKFVSFISVGILLLTTTAADRVKINDDEDFLLPFDPISSRRAECGGTIRAEEHTLSFPGIPGESLIGGETCVWTIHLESMRDFRFNFTQFDVNSDDSSCSSAGVRLYSLSNLVRPGELQNELFCSARLPSDSGYYLGGSIAVLVVYSTSNYSGISSGFTLTWKGVSFDPQPTKHVSSFSTADSGLVGYPVVGNYEPNLVATWAVATEQGKRSDVVVEQVGVEQCPNSDPCTCDALILYEVEERGVLSESVRFCANSSVSVERVGVADRFLLAFFTDFHESPEGTGFSAKYFPTATTVSTTFSPTPRPTTEQATNPTYSHSPRPTTEQATNPTYSTTTSPTTAQTPDPETTPCGGVFSEPTGIILFHLNSNYANSERCVWTIQHPQAISYDFNVTHYFISDPNDGLLISTLSSFSSGDDEYIRDANISNHSPVESSFFLEGDVAILTFYSDASITSRGFRIRYGAVFGSENQPRTGIIVDETSSFIDYPLNNEPAYRNNELATFIFSPDFTFHGDLTNVADYKVKRMEAGCQDWLNVLIFVDMEWVPYPNYSLICDNVTNAVFSHDDMLLFAFKSDATSVHAGFQLNFYTKPSAEYTTQNSF